MGPAGLGYVLVPIAILRGLLGLPGREWWRRFLRMVFGFVLFCVTTLLSVVWLVGAQKLLALLRH